MKKKSETNMWWIIIGFILAAVIMAVVLFITKEGIFKGKDNLDYMSSCKGRGGTCTEENKCTSGTKFYKFGCPENPKDTKDLNVYCCIPDDK